MEVAEYIHNLRLSGGILKSNIVIAAVKGIIAHKYPGLLKNSGGSRFVEKMGRIKSEGVTSGESSLKDEPLPPLPPLSFSFLLLLLLPLPQL